VGEASVAPSAGFEPSRALGRIRTFSALAKVGAVVLSYRVGGEPGGRTGWVAARGASVAAG